jgi:DHA3 family macrolide efflux protein-like MFS transporter
MALDRNTLGILRNKNFKKYFVMTLASRSATSVTMLVIVWYVFAVTQSAIDVAIVGVTETLGAVILSLPAGVWVDRFNRLRLLILSNSIRAFSVTALIFYTLIYGFNLIVIIILLFAWTGAGELYRSGSYSVLPELVGKEDLSAANGLERSGRGIFTAVSIAIGGTLILVVGASIALSWGALGFFIALFYSMLLLSSNRGTIKRLSSKQEKEKSGYLEVRDAITWLISQRGLFLLTISALLFNFFFTISYYFIVVYVKTGLSAGPLIYGAILAFYSIGYAIGSPLVARSKWALSYAGKVWILVYGGSIGTSLLIMGIIPNSILAILLFFIVGLGIGFAGNVWITSAQNIVPEEMRGRYFAFDGLLSFIGGPPAVAAGGVLVLVFGVITVFKLSGLIILIFVLCFSLFKSLWKLDGTGMSK